MSKVTAFLTLLRKPFTVIKDGILAQNENHHKKTIQNKYNLTQLSSIDLIDLFPNYQESLDVYSFLSGTSLITDLVLLKSLAREYKDCSYLEIGSWRGESISNVADVALDCTSITLSATEMRSLNFGEDFIKVHGVFSKNKKNITTIEHNSHTFDFTSLRKKFDLIFIDGDHSYNGVKNDSQKTFSLRRNEKSVIVWHDYSYNTEDVRHSVLNGILDGIPKDKHHNLYHISNTMCAVYIENMTLKTQQTKSPTYPNKIFSIQLSTHKIE